MVSANKVTVAAFSDTLPDWLKTHKKAVKDVLNRSVENYLKSAGGGSEGKIPFKVNDHFMTKIRREELHEESDDHSASSEEDGNDEEVSIEWKVIGISAHQSPTESPNDSENGDADSNDDSNEESREVEVIMECIDV